MTNLDHCDSSDSEKALEPIQLFSEYGTLYDTSLLCQATFLDTEDTYTHHEAEENSPTQSYGENDAEDLNRISCPLYASVLDKASASTLVDSDYDKLASPAILPSQSECIDPRNIFWAYPEDSSYSASS